jgi:cation:H+ antiporter
MIITVLLLILGFACLLISADWLVKGASSLAKRFNVPEIVIGLTIVAFGTSAPELCVNIVSNLKGASEICFGDPIGSNLFNIHHLERNSIFVVRGSCITVACQ